MNPRLSQKILCFCLAMILVLSASACSGVAQPAPTETPVPHTSTPTFTSTPTDTPTPSATSTPTETPLPTATFTPNVTPTQFPEITPAASGKGNLGGLVLWSDRPVAHALVWLCEDFQGGCNGKYTYSVHTDENGYYVFKDVKPGKYVVAMNSFSSSWFIFYFDAKGEREQTVSSGKNLILSPWNIWKYNLYPVSPLNLKLSEAHPTFLWRPYADAAYYEIYIYKDYGRTLVEEARVDGTEYVAKKALSSCEYYWQVYAFNEKGTKLAQFEPQAINNGYFIVYEHFMEFEVINMPTQC